MDKKELRKYIRGLKREHEASELDALSTEICRKLMVHPKVQDAHVVMAYCSLPDEVNTHELLDRLLAEGKQVLLPRVIGDGLMELRIYTGPKDLAEGAFHIMEPTGEPFTDIDSIDVALVPGMSFDKSGNRLGRGKGFYDRFLRHAHLYKIGVCFGFQMVDRVPTGPFDVPVDEVVSNG
jgi:5-formyltetrahydrofolate cyclo-ligase